MISELFQHLACLPSNTCKLKFRPFTLNKDKVTTPYPLIYSEWMNPIPDSQWIGSSTLHKCQLNLCNVVIIALFSHPHFSISLKERKRAFLFLFFTDWRSKALVMAMMEITEAYGVMADGNNIVVGDNNNNNSMMNPPTPTPTKRSRSQRRRRSSLNFTSLDFLSHVPPPPPPLPAARVWPSFSFFFY